MLTRFGKRARLVRHIDQEPRSPSVKDGLLFGGDYRARFRTSGT